MSELQDSNRRVLDVARLLGLEITIEISDAPTRTAEEAALVRGCVVGQIVKSLVFRGLETGNAVLLLVSGANRVNEKTVAGLVGEALVRPDAAFVREVTGFAIGGIPPFGHKSTMACYLDADLLLFKEVYAAAGTPNSTFAIDPAVLRDAIGAVEICVALN